MDDARSSPPRPGTVPPRSCTAYANLSDEELRFHALSASVTLVKGRVLLGNCLLEMFDRELYWRWGYSCMNQFVSLHLKVDPKEAKAARFVAKRLRSLPLLTQAVEDGRIRWSHLFEVCRVATPETEEEWLEAALRPGIRRLRRLVARALEGRPPSEDPLEPVVPTVVRFEMDLIPEEAELQQGAISWVSLQEGRSVTAREAHMELYRAAVEGRIRTSAIGVVETEAMLEDMKRLRQEWDEREAESIRQEVARKASERAVPEEPSESPTSDPADASPSHEQPAEGLTSDPADPFPSEEQPASEGLTSDPLEPPEAYRPPFLKDPAPESYTLRDLSSTAQDDELPYLPFAAALVEEAACPGNPEILVATSSTKKEQADIGCSCKDCSESRSRHIPRWVRRRVMRRDGFRCQCPDCPNTVWLDLHHIVFWCRGGLSVPANLVLLCRRCHRNLHLGRLRIRGNAEVGLTFLDRWGRVLGTTTEEEDRRAAASADRLLTCGHAA